MAAVSVDASFGDGLLHVAAEAQNVVSILELAEDRCCGEHGFDLEACLFGEAWEAASDGRVADHFFRGVTGECAARLKILSVDNQSVPIGFCKADPGAWPGCAIELCKSIRGFGNMHQNPVDLGPVHRARFDGQRMHVSLADLHLVQIARAFASPGEHGGVTIDAEHRAAVPDTFRQCWQIGTRATACV
ncbi:hypothetical protein N566_14995 [Streptomycetaceae bacterium MP113-05]|nr:hypothetical protein N566_14995 [Streptomycetaceae bacterium MP113-05]